MFEMINESSEFTQQELEVQEMLKDTNELGSESGDHSSEAAADLEQFRDLSSDALYHKASEEYILNGETALWKNLVEMADEKENCGEKLSSGDTLSFGQSIDSKISDLERKRDYATNRAETCIKENASGKVWNTNTVIHSWENTARGAQRDINELKSKKAHGVTDV